MAEAKAIRMTDITMGTPFGRARDWLSSRMHKGYKSECPLCGQDVQIYRRTISASMARGLIAVYNAGPVGTPVCFPEIRPQKEAADDAKLAYWGLIEKVDVERQDGNRGGWWALTESGSEFVRGSITVPHFAVVYNKTLLYLEGEQKTIQDCLGKGFRLDRLMDESGRPYINLIREETS